MSTSESVIIPAHISTVWGIIGNPVNIHRILSDVADVKSSDNPRAVGETFVVKYKSGEERINTLDSLSDIDYRISWSLNGATNRLSDGLDLPQETDALQSTIKLRRVTLTDGDPQTYLEWTVNTRSALSGYFVFLAKNLPKILQEVQDNFGRRSLLIASDGDRKRGRSESHVLLL